MATRAPDGANNDKTDIINNDDKDNKIKTIATITPSNRNTD